MDTVICTKSITTKKGKTFTKGEEYNVEMYMNIITVFPTNSIYGIKIKSNKLFTKYFTFSK